MEGVSKNDNKGQFYLHKLSQHGVRGGSRIGKMSRRRIMNEPQENNAATF